MSQIEDRLKEMGLTLPAVPAPGGTYLPAVQTGKLLFVSGHVSKGTTDYKGRVGAELTVEQGCEAARLCALNCLASIKATLGDLDQIARVVRVTGMVNAGTAFVGFPQVVNGASDFLVALFGDPGRHARTAIGAFIPGNYAVEIEMLVELKD